MCRSSQSPRARALCVAAILFTVGLVAVGVAAIWRFDASIAAWFPKCLLYQWTGLHCPGCGTTRGLNALVHGRVVEAIRFNPMLVLGGPLMAWAIWRQRCRELAGAAPAPALAWTLLFVLVVYAAARNLPDPQRSWLAPPAATESRLATDR